MANGRRGSRAGKNRGSNRVRVNNPIIVTYGSGAGARSFDLSKSSVPSQMIEGAKIFCEVSDLEDRSETRRSHLKLKGYKSLLRSGNPFKTDQSIHVDHDLRTSRGSRIVRSYDVNTNPEIKTQVSPLKGVLRPEIPREEQLRIQRVNDLRSKDKL